MVFWCIFFFFKQKTAYDLRISDWSSDVCSSDLVLVGLGEIGDAADLEADVLVQPRDDLVPAAQALDHQRQLAEVAALLADPAPVARRLLAGDPALLAQHHRHPGARQVIGGADRTEERREGNEVVRTCESRWMTAHTKKNKTIVHKEDKTKKPM